MAQGLFFRFVFILYIGLSESQLFLVSGYVGVGNSSFLMKGIFFEQYFSRTPGSYRYTNSIEIVPRFGL